MSIVLIIGGGLAGAVTAKELADTGRPSLIVERTGSLGGKVRNYGCKAAEKCNNCGVCLTKNLWDSVEESDLIDIRFGTVVADLWGEKGDYTAALKKDGAVEYISGISDVVVATGFTGPAEEWRDGFIEISAYTDDEKESIILGSDIERLALERNEAGFFDEIPGSVAFVQCFGSRDKKERAMYCSRVCCAYSTRFAKMIKKFYPACNVTLFYMEMQQVRNGEYFDELKELGVDFIKCRPVKIEAGSPVYVVFDDPAAGKRERLAFDRVILSDGIRPQGDAARVAEIFGLGQDENGFLRYVKDASDPAETGIYITGCAGGPKKIEEVYAESAATAKRILTGQKGE